MFEEKDPLPKEQLRNKLRKLFETSKSQTGQHNVIEAAKKLYNRQGNDEMFLDEFIDGLKYCLIYPDKSGVDKMLHFVARFAASLYSFKALQQEEDDAEEDLEHPFVNGLLNFLFETRSATSVDVRLRCLTLINYILAALPDDSWLPVSIWNGLTEVVRDKLQDRNANVRMAAVLVAKKLQEPKDPKCEIVKLLQYHMTDPSPAVRRAVVTSIALSKTTINEVMGRTLDINENVRRNAFAVISKVKFQSLTISQRLTLLERGLKDRAERVQACVENVLLPQWLEQLENDVLTLIKGLDVVNCSDVALLALKVMAKSHPVEDLIAALKLNQDHLIPAEELTPENALLWKFVAHHLSKSKEQDELIESVLPTISLFTSLIGKLSPHGEGSEDDQWSEVKRKRIVHNLLELAQVFDMKDEVGRANLRQMTLNLLTGPAAATQLVDVLIDLLHVIIPKLDEFITTVVEAVSDIREPLTQLTQNKPKHEIANRQLQVSSMKVELNDLREKEYEAVQRRNYAEAGNLTERIKDITKKLEELITSDQMTLCEVREEKTDPETICKCLKILLKMICVSGIKQLPPGLRSLHESFLENCLRSDDLLTQSLAIQLLAQFCILDKSIAQDNLLGFLCMLSENGEPEVTVPALKAVFDILHTYGTACFEKFDDDAGSDSKNELQDEDDGYSNNSQTTSGNSPASKCLIVLKQLLNCTVCDDLKLTAFEGFCKLLATGVIFSPSLLKCIIVKGFSPVRGSETEDRIRQLFMVFFPLFAGNTPRSQEMIEMAFIPTLRLLVDAQWGSPEADINPKDVAAFLIDYTRPGINKYTSKQLHVHNNLALSICHEILRDASLSQELGHDQIYLKALMMLQLSLDSEAFVQQLLMLLLKIKREITDSTSLRMIKQVQLKMMDRSRGTSSIQNTLSSIQHETSSDSRESSVRTSTSNMSVPQAQSSGMLETVNEALEDYSIAESSTNSDPSAQIDENVAVIPESPEVSDGSDA